MLRLLLALSAILVPGLAHAKKAVVEWKAIKGAVEYELEIQNDGKIVATKKSDDLNWKGDLPPGFYLYKIRGYDKVKRPGLWSEARPLILMPEAPVSQQPPDGQTLSFYSPTASIVLKWEAVKGVSKYNVLVKRGASPVHKGVVPGTSLELKNMVPGEYSWTISAIIEVPAAMQSRAPASIATKSWESKPGDVEEFTLEKHDLEAPKGVAPSDFMPPPASGKLEFAWKAVDGAEAYELTFGGQKVVTKELKAVLPSKGEGKHVWKVRALAHLDANRSPAAVGPETTTKFELSRNALFMDGSGYVALSLMGAPTFAEVTATEFGLQSQPVTLLTGTTRLSGEYWLRPNWGIAAGVDYTSVLVQSGPFSRLAGELTGKYRMAFSNQRFGWFLAPKFGLEYREYNYFTPDVETDAAGEMVFDAVTGQPVINGLNNTQIKTIGPSIGFDLRRQFNEKWSLGTKFSYYFPLTASDSGGSLTKSGSDNYLNLSVGAQGLYWLKPGWGLALGSYYELRRLSFVHRASGASGATADAATSSQATSVKMDGLYFFTSLIITFSSN